MGYRRATLISKDNSRVSLKIAVSDKGDVFLKVVSGKVGSEIVHLAKGIVNEQILDEFSEIVDCYNCDVPIGHIEKVDGIEYILTKASDGCEGCAFEHSSRKCPHVFCLGEDRTDSFDVIFKER